MAGPVGQSTSTVTQAILAAIAKHRDEAQAEGQNFTAPPDAAVGEKSKNPLIVWQSWSPSVAVGSTLICDIGIANPTDTRYSNLFVHLFVGPPDFPRTPDPPPFDFGVPPVDTRFPRLTLPRFAGLTLEPGEVRSLGFALATPTSVERSNYFVNALFGMAGWHGDGRYLDRSLLLFELV